MSEKKDSGINEEQTVRAANGKTVVITDERHHLRKEQKGFAIMGFLDAACYDFFTEFGLYFVTTIGRVSSNIGGFLVSLGTILNAILSPIMGYVSDGTSSKMGRRRIYIFWGGIGCVVALPLMLIPFPFSEGAKLVFYGFAIMLYWTAYTFFFTPYLTFGNDLTKGYDERSNLRAWVTIGNNTGTVVAYSGIMLMVSLFMGLGLTEHMSYFTAMIIMCIMSLISLIVGIHLTKGYDKVIPKEEKEKRNVGKFVKDLFISYGSALKLKSVRLIIAIILFSIIGYTIKTNCEMFMLTYNCGLSAGVISLYFLITTVYRLIIPIPTKWFCDWAGKRGGFIVCVAIYLAAAIFYAIHGINTFADSIIYAVFSGFIVSGYWQIVPAMVYDIKDVDLYFYNKKREGTLVSFQAMVESIGGAIAASISGVILAVYGFNESAAEAGGAVSDHAIDGILYLSTIIPGIFFMIAALLVLIFPITKKRHDKLREANAKGIHASDNDPEYESLKVLN